MVLQAIGDDEIIYVEQQVVSRDLVEHFLRELDGWSLVFNNHARLQPAIIKHTVGPQLLLPHLQTHLIGQQCSWITQVFDEVMHEALTHPLLWSQGYIAPTQHVENAWMLPRALQFYVEEG